MTGIIKQLEVFQKFIEIDLLLFTLRIKNGKENILPEILFQLLNVFFKSVHSLFYIFD